MIYLLLIILFLLAFGLLLLWLGRRTQRQTGLPVGEVIYSDTGAWQRVEEPLLSRKYGLVGKPDYLVQVTIKGRTVTVPVEVKSRKQPPVLLEYHALQLGAYCLLVEDHFKETPPYGLLRYADATVKVPFDERLRTQVLAAADSIRRDQTARDVRRSHREAGRCQQCGYQQACGEQRLVKE
jgi:CRISPR-associated exonuclease Cas4